MPIKEGQDEKGTYVTWGNHGAKYYYHTKEGEKKAHKKAENQAQAAYANGYKGK